MLETVVFKRGRIILLYSLFLFSFCSSQEQVENKYQRCATMLVDSLRRAVHPELGTLEEFEYWLQEKIEQNKVAAKTEISYTLPVIVHIIHNGEAQGFGTNISNAQVQSQIDVLNEDYRKLNSDISKLSFDPYNETNWATLVADCQINFCLAQKDVSGNILASPGIERINRNSKGFHEPPYTIDDIDNIIKPATIWDPNKYLNIWVMDISDGFLGYATFPVSSTLPGITNNFGTSSTDGVAIRYKSFGRVGNVTAPYNKGRTATHEVGHWLGLRHIWGDSNCGSDYCNDTPTQQTSNDGCPGFPHVSCGNGTDGDMFINYMDYTVDACMFLFTNDQKTRMHTVMAHCPFRVNLAKQSANCISSSVEELTQEQINVYPNPSQGEIYISAPSALSSIKIEVVDILGNKILYTKSVDPYNFIRLNFAGIANSVYFVKINTEKGRITKKIVISK